MFLFRAPIVSWTESPKDKRKQKFDKFVLNPGLHVIRKHLAPEVVYTMDDNIDRIEIVKDKDTDSTPMRFRSNYRRIARKQLIYANIYFSNKSMMSESKMFAAVEKLSEKITFFNEEDNFFFKFFTDDLSCQEFFNL